MEQSKNFLYRKKRKTYSEKTKQNDFNFNRNEIKCFLGISQNKSMFGNVWDFRVVFEFFFTTAKLETFYRTFQQNYNTLARFFDL